MKIVNEQTMSLTFEGYECQDFLGMLDDVIDLANDYDLSGELAKYFINLKLAINDSN